MSAFIVEPKTINRIITFLNWEWEYGSFRSIKIQLQELGYCTDLQTLGRAMMNLNVDAVNQRYREQTDPRRIDYQFHPEPVNRIQAFKSLRCWLYQCTEGHVPLRSLYQIMETFSHDLAEGITAQLQEYELAEWG